MTSKASGFLRAVIEEKSESPSNLLLEMPPAIRLALEMLNQISDLNKASMPFMAYLQFKPMPEL